MPVVSPMTAQPTTHWSPPVGADCRVTRQSCSRTRNFSSIPRCRRGYSRPHVELQDRHRTRRGRLHRHRRQRRLPPAQGGEAAERGARRGVDRPGDHGRAPARLKIPSREALEKIEGSLRVAQSWSNTELVQATEPYLVGAREILRRRADASRLTQKAAASRAALAAHIARAPRRDTPWIRAAMDLKKQVERDHFDLDVQLNALADLLDTLPEANKRLTPHVQALPSEDARRRDAREGVLAEAKRRPRARPSASARQLVAPASELEASAR